MSCLRSMSTPGKMSTSLRGPTLWLVSYYETSPMLVLSLPGSLHAFPPREGMGMLFPGLLLGAGRKAMTVPKLRRSLLEDTRLGQGLPW